MEFRAPERCTLINLDTGERAVCQFNPGTLDVQGGAAKFARLEPLGAAYPSLHYCNTENRKLPLSFYMDAIGTGFDVSAFLGFLRQATLPSSGKGLSKPPAILLVWPGVITVVGHVNELSWNAEQVSPEGALQVCTATCLLEIDEQATHDKVVH
jgi:hypothetical protein